MSSNGHRPRSPIHSLDRISELAQTLAPLLEDAGDAGARKSGGLEFASATDPAVLRVLLKVKDGMGGDYWWVECGASECAWQVPYYAESVG